MGRKSRNKGAVGEREFAEKLGSLLGTKLQRGIQYRDGGKEAGDIIGLDRIHVEVKRTEALHLWRAIDQANADAPPGTVPIVAHRPNRRPWLLIFEADRLLELVAAVNELIKPGPKRENRQRKATAPMVVDKTSQNKSGFEFPSFHPEEKETDPAQKIPW